ncbi:MAG TPA: hypothetical protein VJN70_13780 [Gemmatimonadaceae bacterium]|nr:hypothetical protein [Gemmatimonadaceae bacterium]
MRKYLRSSMFAVGLTTVVVAACGRNEKTANRPMSEDLKRDLQLASSTSLDLASQQASASFPLTEIPISPAPSPTSVLKKAKSGPKAVRSKHPTVKATPEPSVVANAEDPQTDVMQKAPSPTTEQVPDPSAPAVPRPSPTPTIPNGGEGAHGRDGGGPNTGAGDGGRGPSTGDGIGGIIGGIFGVIVRGGVVDGDHCDPRTDRRRGPRRLPPPYNPNNPYPFPSGGGVLRPIP